MALEESARDVYLRHINTEGKSYVAQHRVWDTPKFLAARQREAAELNSKQKPGEPRKAAVVQITADQYRDERKAS